MKDIYNFEIELAKRTLVYIQLGRRDYCHGTTADGMYLHKSTQFSASECRNQGCTTGSISSGVSLANPCKYLGTANTKQADQGQYSADRHSGHYAVLERILPSEDVKGDWDASKVKFTPITDAAYHCELKSHFILDEIGLYEPPTSEIKKEETK